ncbi:hypothetical protein AVEN_113549-1 [Araneus ventricosus]|uniref:Uncharacterized protein n=1 Tax=Araneus ventricosus TaxID=182803 RepID=A0A4Y2G7N6_ARAVE|nr:hypothetical protein AVEN_113549-1 [Araneus ventricosus]
MLMWLRNCQPGHTGHDDNENVDKLSKGRKRRSDKSIPQFIIPSPSLKLRWEINCCINGRTNGIMEIPVAMSMQYYLSCACDIPAGLGKIQLFYSERTPLESYLQGFGFINNYFESLEGNGLVFHNLTESVLTMSWHKWNPKIKLFQEWLRKIPSNSLS